MVGQRDRPTVSQLVSSRHSTVIVAAAYFNGEGRFNMLAYGYTFTANTFHNKVI